MTFLRRLIHDEQPPEDDDTERLEPMAEVTLTPLPDVCIMATLIGPGGTVHNVMLGSYVYRVMLANDYKVVKP